MPTTKTTSDFERRIKVTNDVRVKLSAEGVQEVVDAMKRIRDEAKETGEHGKKSFEAFREGIKEVGKELVGFVALGAVIEKTKELFNEVAKGALDLEKMNRETGISTDKLQAMHEAADDLRITQESMNKGLEIFTRNVGLAENGSKKAAAGFSELGIKVKDLKELNADQQFELTIKKLAEVDNQARRTAIGSQIFGKSFIEIAPAIQELAEQGFDPFLNKLKSFGVYMDESVIKQMAAAKQASKDLGDETKGLATQFLVGLMPAVTQSMEEIVKATSGNGVNAFQTLGKWVGWLALLVVNSFKVIGATIGETLGAVSVTIGNQIDILTSKASVLQKMKAFSTLANPVQLTAEIAKNSNYAGTKEAAADLWEGLKNGPKPLEAKEEKKKALGGDDESAALLEQMAKARLALIEAQLGAELKIYEAHAKLKEGQDKQEYDAGRMSLEDYYKDRENIINGRVDKELQILQKRRDAVAAQHVDINDDAGAIQKRAQLAAIDGDIAAKQIERATTLAALATEQRAEQQKNYEAQLSAEAKLLQMEGDKAAAARLMLDIETKRLALQLQKSGGSASEIQNAVDTYKAQAGAKIDYDQTKQDAEATLTQLNTQIKAIQDQVKTGILFPIQGEQEIMNLERERLPVLQQIADELQRLAEITKDPSVIAQAEQYKQKINEIGVATDEAALHMGQLKTSAEDAFQSGLGTFLANTVTQTQSVGDAFRQMGQSIIQTLARVEAEYLAKQFVKWMANNGQGSAGQGGATGAPQTDAKSSVGGLIGGLFGGGGASGAAGSAATTANTTAITANTTATTASATASSSLLGAITANTTALLANTTAVGAGAASSTGSAIASGVGSAAASYADGGHISGAGTSTSDSIPAMLSDGEFVIKASAVQRPGMLSLLHAINGSPGYSKGNTQGVQRYAEGGMVGGGGVTQNNYRVDASEIPAHVIHQAVRERVLEVIANNPTSVRNSIG